MKRPWSEPWDNFKVPKWEFLGSLAVRTWCFHCQGHWFNPWCGIKILQARVCGVGGNKKKIYICQTKGPLSPWSGGSRGEWQKIWRNDGQKYSKFDEDYQVTDPKSSANLKHRKHEKYTRDIMIKFLKINDKEKTLI